MLACTLRRFSAAWAALASFFAYFLFHGSHLGRRNLFHLGLLVSALGFGLQLIARAGELLFFLLSFVLLVFLVGAVTSAGIVMSLSEADSVHQSCFDVLRLFLL